MIGRLLLGLVGFGLLCSWRMDSPDWYFFQALIAVLLGTAAVGWLRGRFTPVWSWSLAPMLLIAAWPAVQLAMGVTVYRYATELELLRWTTYAAIFALAVWCYRSTEAIDRMLHWSILYGVGLAAVSTMQHFAASDKMFWLFETAGRPDMGPFLNRDHYAVFMELVLPMAIIRAFEDSERRFVYILAAAGIFASVIAGASRAGAFFVTAETLACLAVVNARQPRRKGEKHPFWRQYGPTVGVLAAVVLAVLVVGPETVWKRFQADDPYAGRREMALSSIAMIGDRPALGWGMGTWTVVYPAYAIADFGKYVNAAHNDWLQWACDGGIPLAGLFLALFGTSLLVAWRVPWALGVPVMFLHCLADFPIGDGRYLPAALFLVLGAAVGFVGERETEQREGRKMYSIEVARRR